MFSDLTSADLDLLSGAIRAGRLTLPASGAALDRLGLPRACAVQTEFDALLDSGFVSSQIVRLIEAVAVERARFERQSASLEVVATGPSGGAKTRDTSIVLEELFVTAKKRILLVGFALHGGMTILKTLAKRLEVEDELDVTLCLDISRVGTDTTRESEIVERFADRFVRNEWPGRRLPQVYYDPRGLAVDARERAVLHAKVAIADGFRGLVTSANLTTAAQKRNIEVGLYFANEHVAQTIENHFRGLIRIGALEQIAFAVPS
jgi:phosphatidylserine/phosphatidylglycerophosphate/cardiolipin synthase-like enzyme